MKEVEVVAYDDLDRAEKGIKTRADQTRYFGLDGKWVELDLTAEHDAELVKLAERYLAAGTRPEKPPTTGKASGSRFAEARARNEAILAFAQERGLKFTALAHGGHYFPVATKRAYEQHEAALAAVTGGAADDAS